MSIYFLQEVCKQHQSDNDLFILNQKIYLLSMLTTVPYFTSSSLNNKAIPPDLTFDNYTRTFLRKSERKVCHWNSVYIFGIWEMIL